MASSQDCKKFIAQIAPIIQQEAKQRGYLICSTVIAQACIESAYGTSSLGWKYHNYFGMKCGSSWKGASVNMRTKEARRYTINGADEYSAMASAEGKVQEKGYNATFPILLNVKGEPSYFISLKDNAGTIKA